jgi:diguanylate cyclase (GGDEF)-like protein/PAS domain S-box-containing protein
MIIPAAKPSPSVILVVDDDETNRQIVTTLLDHHGHRVHEASDGREGLEVALSVRPDLVISDILMPSMDGYEFVRQLRAHPALERVEVIFYTANYHEREAQNLAQACRVARVLAKPCAPADILSALEQVLNRASRPASPIRVGQEFDHEHLQVVTDKLAEKVSELQSANSRLQALTDLNLQLASERSPQLLLDKVCYGARSLIGAKYAVLAVTEKSDSDRFFFTTSGVQFTADRVAPPLPRVDPGPLGRVYSSQTTWRARVNPGEPPLAVYPSGYPAARAYLAAPISSLTRTYGWLCLADKLGADSFTAEDEHILGILAAQVGRVYENETLAREIQASEERFRQLAENIQDVFFIVSADWRELIYVSPAVEQIWGRRLDSPKIEDWIASVHADDRPRILDLLRSGTPHPVNDEIEFRIVQPTGAVRWIFSRHFALRDERGEPYRVVGVATDVTERKQAEARIKHLNRVYGLLSGLNALSVRARSQEMLFAEACNLAVKQGDYQLAWIGWLRDGAECVTPVAWAGDSTIATQLLRGGMSVPIDADVFLSAAIRRQSPSVCNDLEAEQGPVLIHRGMIEQGLRSLVALPLIVHERSVGCLVLGTDFRGAFDAAEMQLLVQLADDISFALDHLEKVEKLNYLAYHDPLTGLPNRALFTDQLAEHIAAARRDDTKLAVIIADPERFETINDIFGRGQGDALLKSMAERLSACVADSTSVARIGPGQFAAVLPFSGDDGVAARVFEEFYRVWLDEPFDVNGNELAIACLAGIALHPSDGADAESLFKSADAAMKRAKATGDKIVFYTREIHDWNAERLSMETRLRYALENREFVLHYQPKVDVETRKLEGLEALIRWQSPELGLMPPAKFIPLMEETGMIVDVGAWVLRQASADRSSWLEQGLPAPRIAVNVSTVQLRRPNFVEIVQRVIDEALGGGHGVRARGAGIDIEVTESLLVEGAEVNMARLRAIRDLGVGIAIDDFGTGYSSLGYLAKLPVECLKIDRSFTISMLDDPSAMMLVSTMITLAHSLKLKVVAEGVESEEQAKFLRLLRCDQMQGYLMNRPLPYGEMTELLRRSKSVEADH